MQHLIIERRGDPNVREKEKHHIPMCDHSAGILQGLDIHNRNTLLRELGVLGSGDSVLGWDSERTPAEREQQEAAVPPSMRTYRELAEIRDRFEREIIAQMQEAGGRLPDEMALKLVNDLDAWLTSKKHRLLNPPRTS